MSSSDFTLEASPRQDVGKGASRRLRRNQDEIPAIIYGGGQDPANISLKHKDIMHAVENEAFFSHIITIKLGKDSESVVIKDLQRHPAKPRILHADFLRVLANQAIHVKVPLHFLNEEKCVGVKQSGGTVNHLLNELEISCLPKDLPEYIEVDVLNLDVGDSLHISDISLPEGVSSVDLSHGESGDHAIVSVHIPRVVVEEEPAEEEDAGDKEAPEADSDDEDKED